MGSIYFRQNMFDDAVKEFTPRLPKIKPEYVEAYQRLWLAYKKLGMNDRAEEELLKYKKLIEERMQTMGGGSPQVAKPVSPPHNEKNGLRRPNLQETKVEPYRPPKTLPPETTVPETKVTETRPSEVETGLGKSTVVKPVIPPMQEEYRPPVVAPVPPPVVARPVEPPKPPQEMKSATKLEEYKSPYIKVDKKDPAYKNLLNHLKKWVQPCSEPSKKRSGTVTELQRTYFGKLIKGFLYYIVIVQIWLGIVASFCIYF